MTTWEIARQGHRPIAATRKRIALELGRLKPQGPSSFAVLSAAPDRYYQVAGGGGGMMLEKRVADTHLRAYQESPVVPFADGTELRFAGAGIALRRDEWFRVSQLVDVLARVIEVEEEPAWLRWRDIGALTSTPSR